MQRTHECENFVKQLHTDPVYVELGRSGLNWKMGYTLTGYMGYTARTAF